jgi:hypothetical protein
MPAVPAHSPSTRVPILLAHLARMLAERSLAD